MFDIYTYELFFNKISEEDVYCYILGAKYLKKKIFSSLQLEKISILLLVFFLIIIQMV